MTQPSVKHRRKGPNPGDVLRWQGFDLTTYDASDRCHHPRCSRCQVIVTNGVAMHALRCPNDVESRVDEATGLMIPRGDEQCFDCKKKPAVTTDGLFCLRCLRSRINAENPDPPPVFSDQLGRSQLDFYAMGGQAEMNDDGDDDDADDDD